MDRIISYTASSISPEWRLTPPSGDTYVYYNINLDAFTFSTQDEIFSETSDTDCVILTSDSLDSGITKYLIPVDNEFFHLFHDTIPAILRLHRDDPTAEFFIFKQHKRGKISTQESAQKLHEYLEELLTAKNIPYTLITPPDGPGSTLTILKGRSFVDFRGATKDRNSQPFMSFKEIAEWAEDVRENADDFMAEPYRKVYLSRRHLKEARSKIFNGIDENYSGYKNDLRMNNEHVLEEFFISKGYEVVVPEEDFSSLREQIRYMKSVKVLVSITSSGLTNSLFMKNGQTVIEITAEVVGVSGHGSGGAYQAKLDYYLTDSFFKDHIHIGVPSNRDPLEVVSKLKRIIDLLD